MATQVEINELEHVERVTLDSRGRKRITLGEDYADSDVKIYVDADPDGVET